MRRVRSSRADGCPDDVEGPTAALTRSAQDGYCETGTPAVPPTPVAVSVSVDVAVSVVVVPPAAVVPRGRRAGVPKWALGAAAVVVAGAAVAVVVGVAVVAAGAAGAGGALSTGRFSMTQPAANATKATSQREFRTE